MSGDNNKYQYFTLLLFSLQTIVFGVLILGIPFLFAQPRFRCPTTDDPFRMCSEDDKCVDGIVDHENSPHSISLEFGVYCEHALLKDYFGSSFFFCGMSASLFFSYINDRKGRKAALFAGALIGGVALFTASLVYDYLYLVILLSIASIGIYGIMNLYFVYFNEIGGE
jgi:MFS family permease